ncbi:FkbM family methyltransferase [bacterium]|nr:FkbM family methyltransferase [bacterium]
MPRFQRKIIDGITYALDLSEGIDLSLYLTGGFQKHLLQRAGVSGTVRTVFDVGANSGVMSLQFVQRYPEATVYAFEPSEYANRRFDENLALNPELAERIVRVKSFVADRKVVPDSYTSYSSWRVDTLRRNGHPRHPVHYGVSHESVDRYTTLDDFCSEHAIQSVDLIKIDTDGYEYEVLQGAARILRENHPTVLFELALYMLEERHITYPALVQPLLDNGYWLSDLQSWKHVSIATVRELVPRFGSIDVLAVPCDR